MNNGLLMRVLHSFANVNEQLEPFAGGQPMFVTESIYWNSGDELHDEVRSPLRGRTGIEDLCNGWMIHECKGLPLGFKPYHDLARVHARLDQLERHPSPNGMLLFNK